MSVDGSLLCMLNLINIHAPMRVLSVTLLHDLHLLTSVTFSIYCGPSCTTLLVICCNSEFVSSVIIYHSAAVCGTAKSVMC